MLSSLLYQPLHTNVAIKNILTMEITRGWPKMKNRNLLFWEIIGIFCSSWQWFFRLLNAAILARFNAYFYFHYLLIYSINLLKLIKYILFRTRLISRGHLIQTFLHMLQITVSYLLMLVFMTYNTWLCLSVVLGAGFGYFLFGLKRLTSIDVNEHCH